jgi:hypothetical protein
MTEDTTHENQTPTNDVGWIAGLPTELKALVETKGYRTPADVVQAYAHAQRALGSEKIPLPKDGIWDQVARERLGIPAVPAGYALRRPDLPDGIAWDEGFEQAALPIAHGLGLTPQQLQGLMDFYASHQAEAFATAGHARQHQQDQAATALKDEWGPDYAVKLAQAARAARYFGGEDLLTLLNESGLGNNPQLIRAFEKAGAVLGEDTLKGGNDGSGQGLAPTDAMRKARELMQKPGYLKREHPDHFDLVAEVNAMFERAFGQANR